MTIGVYPGTFDPLTVAHLAGNSAPFEFWLRAHSFFRTSKVDNSPDVAAGQAAEGALRAYKYILAFSAAQPEGLTGTEINWLSEYLANAAKNLIIRASLPGEGGFGWLWIDACDDRHRHLADAVRQKLARRSRPLLEDHRDRLARREEKLAQHAARLAQRAAEKEASAAAERAAAQAEEQRQRELAAMTPNHRRIAQFAADFAARADQLRGNKENPNATFHGLARALARDAAAWPLDERLAAADAIEHWLPRVVRIDLKDERKKLKLAALRTPT